jgi:hypothetical protein
MNNKNNWYNTGRQSKFFIVDAKVSIFLIFFLVHIRLETFALLIFIFVFFYILEMKKINLRIFIKLVRSFFSGKIKRIRKSNK